MKEPAQPASPLPPRRDWCAARQRGVWGTCTVVPVARASETQLLNPGSLAPALAAGQPAKTPRPKLFQKEKEKKKNKKTTPPKNPGGAGSEEEEEQSSTGEAGLLQYNG